MLLNAPNVKTPAANPITGPAIAVTNIPTNKPNKNAIAKKRISKNIFSHSGI